MAKLSDINLYSIGNTIQLVGALYGGEGKLYMAYFPEESARHWNLQDLEMDSEGWKTFLRQTDFMEAEVMRKDAASGELRKAIMRKSQRQIDQVLTWKVLRRDQYMCCYCGNDNTPLTIDHLVPWENGGPTIEDNLLTSCRKCNRTRGNAVLADWLQHPYYLDVSKQLTPARRQANEKLVNTLGLIPLLVHQRSR